MSEDLRYYFLDGEHEDRPAIPADEGWNNMRQLLDKHLPQKNKKPARRYFFFGVTGLMCTAFVISSLTLQTDIAKREKEKNLPASIPAVALNDPFAKTNSQFKNTNAIGKEKFKTVDVAVNQKTLALQRTSDAVRAEADVDRVNSFSEDHPLLNKTTTAK